MQARRLLAAVKKHPAVIPLAMTHVVYDPSAAIIANPERGSFNILKHIIGRIILVTYRLARRLWRPGELVVEP